MSELQKVLAGKSTTDQIQEAMTYLYSRPLQKQKRRDLKLIRAMLWPTAGKNPESAFAVTAINGELTQRGQRKILWSIVAMLLTVAAIALAGFYFNIAVHIDDEDGENQCQPDYETHLSPANDSRLGLV